MTNWQINMITLALPPPMRAPRWHTHCFPPDGPVVAEVKLTCPLAFPPPPLTWCACIPNSLAPVPESSYNPCTLKANHLILRTVSAENYDVNEWHHSFKSKERQRVYCTKPRLIDNRALHRLCKIREATTWEWMNGSCVLNGWLTTPTPFSEVLANILGTASVKHHYANG